MLTRSKMISTKSGPSTRDKIEMPDATVNNVRIRHMSDGRGVVQGEAYEVSFLTEDGVRDYTLLLCADDAFEIVAGVLGVNKDKFKRLLRLMQS